MDEIRGLQELGAREAVLLSECIAKTRRGAYLWQVGRREHGRRHQRVVPDDRDELAPPASDEEGAAASSEHARHDQGPSTPPPSTPPIGCLTLGGGTYPPSPNSQKPEALPFSVSLVQSYLI